MVAAGVGRDGELMMGESGAGVDVPIVCTLSPNRMVERLTEFEALFAAELTGVEREPLRLRLTFADVDAERRGRIRELFDAERRCCAFLSFAYEQVGDGLTVEITAPAEAAPTLDGMQTLAERNAPPRVVARGWTG